jgi:hypothetical protein
VCAEASSLFTGHLEGVLADDAPIVARRHDVVRQELAETIHLNETLGAFGP